MPDNIQHYCIEPAQFKLDGGAMFGIIPKPLWNKVAPADEQNRIDLALRLWLIKTSKRVILVDTGIGDYHGDKFDSRFDVRGGQNPIENALSDMGIKPDQITDLIISHLHFDHVGGIVKKDENGNFHSVFKNCTLHLHKKHYEYSHNPTQRDTGSFHTQYFEHAVRYYKDAKKIQWHDGEEGDIFNDEDIKLNFICSHGHTPHLMHPYTEEYIYLADLIPTSNHIHIPWVMGYDISPGVTTQDKEKFLQFIFDKKLKIIFEHDPEFWGCTLKTSPKHGYEVDQKFSSEKKKTFLI